MERTGFNHRWRNEIQPNFNKIDNFCFVCVCEQFDRRGVQPEEAEQNNNNSAVPDRQTNRVGKLRSATYLKLHVL